MNALEASPERRRTPRLAIASLAALVSLLTAAPAGTSTADRESAETPAVVVAESASLPGPGPLPARVPPPLLKAHQGAKTLDDAVDQCVIQSMAVAGTPGASVAVALDGALILERGYGIFLADLDEDGELDSDFEFIERGSPERAGWLRNRSVVGVRRTTPRPAGGTLTP